MVSQNPTKPVRIYESDIPRLFNLINSDRRKIPDVINYLLDVEAKA